MGQSGRQVQPAFINATQGLLGRTPVFPFAIGSARGAIWSTEPGINPLWKVCLKLQNKCFSSMSSSPFLALMHLTVVLQVYKLGLGSICPHDMLLVKVTLGHNLTSPQIMKNGPVGTLIQSFSQDHVNIWVSLRLSLEKVRFRASPDI